MNNPRRCDRTTPFYRARMLKFTDLVQFRIIQSVFMYNAHKTNYGRIFTGYSLNINYIRGQNQFIRTHASATKRHMSLIVCASKLLNSFNINVNTIRYFHHFILRYSKYIIQLLYAYVNNFICFLFSVFVVSTQNICNDCHFICN